MKIAVIESTAIVVLLAKCFENIETLSQDKTTDNIHEERKSPACA